MFLKSLRVRWQRLPESLWQRRASRERAARARALVVQMLVDDFAVAPQKALICHRSSGAPYVPDVSVHVSVSHSRRVVAVAGSCFGPVGVDVEARPLPKSWRSIAETFFTEGERRCLDSDDGPALFWRFWTTKEALTKLHEGQLTDFLGYDTTRVVDGQPFVTDSGKAICVRAQLQPQIYLAVAHSGADVGTGADVDIAEVPERTC